MLCLSYSIVKGNAVQIRQGRNHCKKPLDILCSVRGLLAGTHLKVRVSHLKFFSIEFEKNNYRILGFEKVPFYDDFTKLTFEPMFFVETRAFF